MNMITCSKHNYSGIGNLCPDCNKDFQRLKELNAEMLKMLKMVHSCCSCVRESNVEFCDRCDSDDLIKSIIEKAEGMK